MFLPPEGDGSQHPARSERFPNITKKEAVSSSCMNLLSSSVAYIPFQTKKNLRILLPAVFSLSSCIDVFSLHMDPYHSFVLFGSSFLCEKIRCNLRVRLRLEKVL